MACSIIHWEKRGIWTHWRMAGPNLEGTQYTSLKGHTIFLKVTPSNLETKPT